MLRIREGRRLLGADTSVEFTADGSGNITRKFWQGVKEQPFEPEGRKWLATMLPRFIRQSGIGAPARVARIHKSGGVTGVLAEVSRIEGSWAKHVYLKELMKVPGLSAADVQRVFNQAGTEIDSDFELASFLISSSRQITDDATRRAYLDAAKIDRLRLRAAARVVVPSAGRPGAVAARGRTPRNQHVHRFGFRGGLTPRPVRPPAADRRDRAAPILQGARDRRQFVRARPGPADAAPADRPLARVRASALESAGAVESDFEAANVLLQFVKAARSKAHSAPRSSAQPERSTPPSNAAVYCKRLPGGRTVDETVLELVRSTKGISSNFERSQVLLTVASNHSLTRDARDAYIDASENSATTNRAGPVGAREKRRRLGRRSSPVPTSSVGVRSCHFVACSCASATRMSVASS
jgi:hypothetical protein